MFGPGWKVEKGKQKKKSKTSNDVQYPTQDGGTS